MARGVDPGGREQDTKRTRTLVANSTAMHDMTLNGIARLG